MWVQSKFSGGISLLHSINMLSVVCAIGRLLYIKRYHTKNETCLQLYFCCRAHQRPVYTVQTQLQSHISFFYWYIKKCWRLMRTMYKSMLWRWTGKNLKWHVGVMNRQLLVSSISLSLLQFNCSSSEMRFLNYRFVVHTIFLFSVHTFFYGFNVLVLNSSVDQT